MRLRPTSPTFLYSTYFFTCILESCVLCIPSSFTPVFSCILHLPLHLYSCTVCTLCSIYFYTCILMYTPPTFTPVFLYHVYFVFHLLYHVYLNLGMLLRSTFRSTTSTTPPNQIPLLEEQCPWTMSTFFWVLFPKCFTSTALKIIMIKSKHVCSFCSKGGHGVLEYFLFLQSGERNGSF